MSVLLSIDPGSELSGFVFVDTDVDPDFYHKVYASGHFYTKFILDWVRKGSINFKEEPVSTHPRCTETSLIIDQVICETIKCRGRGQAFEAVFDTCRAVGRVQEAYYHTHGSEVLLYDRRNIKKVMGRLVGSPVKNNSTMVQAVKVLYKKNTVSPFWCADPVGHKGLPGPLYGVKSHAWQALGQALVHVNGGV